MLSSLWLPHAAPTALGFHGGTLWVLPLMGPPENRGNAPWRVAMRDRSKNRKPLQKGRNLSIEAIHAVQALKRAKGDKGSLERVLNMQVRRLLKLDMMAVLGDLLRQEEGMLALQVFEAARREHWYKPRFFIYADMVKVLARNGSFDKVELICSYMKMEIFKDDTEGFNTLLAIFLESGFIQNAMDCWEMMKVWETDPDRSTFRLLICQLEARGEFDIAVNIRQEATKYFGRLDFLEENQEREVV